MTLAYPLTRRPLGSTDVEVSTLGFGSAALGNLYRVISDTTAQAALRAASLAGIHYIDTAPHYGQGLAERRIGAALAEAPTPVVLSTKVGRRLTPIDPPPPGTERHGFVDGDPFEPVFDYSYDGVMRSFEASCHRLGRDHIDILLAHDLGHATHGDAADAHMTAFLSGGYRAMRALKDQGAVGAIGLGVNECAVCETVMADADIDVVLLAGRYTLLEQAALDRFLPDCLARSVAIIAGGPFNSGILAGDSHYNYAPAPAAIVARVQALRAVCAAHGVALAAAALQFPLTHPAVASVIPGMADAGQVEANLALLAIDIPGGLWDDLKSEGLLHPDAPTTPVSPRTATAPSLSGVTS